MSETPRREDAPRDPTITRRQAIGAGLIAASAVAVAARSEPGDGPRAEPVQRLPTVFVPHGGGPWPFVDVPFADKAEMDDLAGYLRSVRGLPERPPKALLVVSAHWEAPVPTVMSSPAPPMLYDYYGFPPASYQITWPAPGDPALAARVRALLHAAGIPSAEDTARGFDHGTFVPLKLTWPEADVPTVQLSLIKGLDPAAHLALGQALAPLRDEAVLIIGSGMTFHDLRAFGPRSYGISETFDGWLRETAALDPAERDRRLAEWTRAPAARAAHPREEHLLPLMVVAGAAGADRGALGWKGTFAGTVQSAYHFG